MLGLAVHGIISLVAKLKKNNDLAAVVIHILTLRSRVFSLHELLMASIRSIHPVVVSGLCPTISVSNVSFISSP